MSGLRVASPVKKCKEPLTLRRVARWKEPLASGRLARGKEPLSSPSEDLREKTAFVWKSLLLEVHSGEAFFANERFEIESFRYGSVSRLRRFCIRNVFVAEVFRDLSVSVL